MAYTDPLSWKIGDFFDIYDIDPSAGYAVQPFGDPNAYVYLKDGTILIVGEDGTIVGYG